MADAKTKPGKGKPHKDPRQPCFGCQQLTWALYCDSCAPPVVKLHRRTWSSRAQTDEYYHGELCGNNSLGDYEIS